MGSFVATLVLFAAQLGVEADARSETRVGQGPIIPGGESRAFVAQMVVPLLELNAIGQGLSVRLRYLPRIYWQDPRPFEASGMLVLHTANLLLDAHVLGQTTVSASATGSVGQPDYTVLPRLLGAPTQSSLPVITTVASVSGRAGLATRVTRRVRLELAAELFRWWSLDAIDPLLAPTTVTAMTTASVFPSALVRVTARNDLGARVALGEVWYSTGARYLNATPMALWELRLTAQQRLHTSLGVAFVHPVAIGPGATSTANLFSPVGAVELEGLVARSEGVSVRINAGSGVTYYFDPVLGIANPRGFVRAGGTITVAPNWMGSVGGEFATGPPPGPAPDSDVTAYIVTAFARRLLSPNLFAEVGGTWADRAPAFTVSSFGFHQPLRWVYVSLTGTTRAIGRWSE